MTTADASARCDIFLCHNRHDQHVVKQVAEGLELEFGIPHFLDDYAIPAGEAFLPWIENALASSRGCAVFLGPNGWGPTHLVEAEKALLRYQADPAFRLIPVVVGDLREEDASRLGNGTVFRDINWIRISSSTPDLGAIEKLRAALTDSPTQTGRGPARLTPYMLRREALRWGKTGNDDLLPRGRALTEAQQLRVAASDLTSGEEIAAFLQAAVNQAVGRLRRILAIALASSIALAGLAAVAFYQRTVAQSRELAALALATEKKDDALLLAVAAWDVWPTVESRASVLSLLTGTRHAQRFLHGHESGVRAVDIDADARWAVAGGEGGALHVWDLRRPEAPPRVFPAPPSIGIGANRIHDLAIVPDRAEVLVAYERGAVRIWSIAEGSSRAIAGWPAPTAGTARVSTDYYGADPEPPRTRGERAVTAVAVRPGSTTAAGVDTSGRVFLIDVAAGMLRWIRSTDLRGVESVHWSPDGRLIIVGDESGTLHALSVAGESVVVAKAGAHRARLVMLAAAPRASSETFLTLDSGGAVNRWRADGDRLELVRESALAVSAVSAGIGPGADQVFVATRAGAIRSFELDSGEEREDAALEGHRLAATSVRCQASGRHCISGGVGGEIVVWDLARQHPLLARTVRSQGLIHGFWRRPLDGLGVLTQPEGALVWSSLVSDKKVARPMGAVAALAPRADGAEIAIAATNQAITVLPSFTASGGPAYSLPDDASGQLSAIAIARSGRWLIAADTAPRVVAWRREQPGAPVIASPVPALVSSIAIARDELSFVVGTLSGEIVHWSLDPPDSIPRARKIAGGPVFALAFSRAGDSLYVGSGAADRNIRILDYPSLRALGQLPERHAGSISAIVTSTQDELLASASDDGVVELWDLGSRREIGALPHELDTIFQAMAFDGGRGKLLVASDHTVFEWDVTDFALIAAACRIANRTAIGGQSPSVASLERGVRQCMEGGAMHRVDP